MLRVRVLLRVIADWTYRLTLTLLVLLALLPTALLLAWLLALGRAIEAIRHRHAHVVA